MDDTLRFEVRDGALYAANTGRAFDRLGVISITRVNLSAKGRLPPEDEIWADGELVAGLLAMRLDTYRRDRNALREDANQEEEVSRDYSGRCLWELLQNADDAMAPEGSPSSELIGAKGLGFKSILEICDRPEIHSGPFNFGFDPDLSAALLEEIVEDPPRLTFRLPHPAKPDLVVRRLRSQGFQTVVRLPFRDASAQAEVVARLEALQPHFLLLSQHLTTLDIRLPARHRVMQKTQNRGVVVLSISDGEAKTRQRWRVWRRAWPSSIEGGKRLSAAIAAPLDDGTPAGTEVPLHVFYPTEESVSAAFLVHGSFEVTANRNHLRDGPQDREVLDALSTLAREAARVLPPALVVRLFAPLVRERQSGVRKLPKKIIQSLASAVAKSEFVPVCGGGKARPDEARTWAHRLGDVLLSAAPEVRGEQIARPELAGVFGLLEGAFRARPMGSLDAARALGHVRCRGLEGCLAAIYAAQGSCLGQTTPSPELLARLAKVPMWLSGDGTVRALGGALPLVQARPDDWPAWLSADVIDEALLARLPDPPDGPARKAWDQLLADRLLRKPAEFLRQALAPTLATWTDAAWSEHGWEVFALLDRWLPELEWAKVRPYVSGAEEDTLRVALASAMRAPSGRDWVPSLEAYAGVEILGPEVLAAYARKELGAPLVNRPKGASGIGKARWRALLRYVGVSWEPKFRNWPLHGVGPNKTAFLQDTDPQLRYPRPDWYLEAFPACVAGAAPPAMARMLESLLMASGPLMGRWLKMWGSATSHRPGEFSSYVDWQLRSTRHLPCRPALGHSDNIGAPSGLFWPDKGLRGVTPEVSLAGVREDRRSTLQKLYVSRLGVQTQLPSDPEVWLNWAEALAHRVVEQPAAVTQRVLREFYGAYLVRGLADAGTPSKLVCESALGLRPVPPRDAIWLDKAELAPPSVQDALIQSGLAIFPVHLDHGADAHRHWKVRRASDAVEITPHYASENPRKSALLARRLEVRRKALVAICETKGVPWNRRLTVRAVHGLQLQVRVGGELLVERPTLAAFADGTWLVSLDGDEFDALSKACVEGLSHATDLKRRIAAVLRAKPSELSSVLLEEGIPTYRLRDLQSEYDTVDADGGEGESKEEAAPAEGEDDGGPKPLPAPAGSGGDVAPKPPAPPSGKLAQRELYNSTPSQYSTDLKARGRGGNNAAVAMAQAAHARGLAAEAWFAEALRKTLPAGWLVEFNLRDEFQRESDVVLTRRGKSWHLELKALTTELFFWSDLERQKAALHLGRYFMALMVGDGAGGYRVHWCWDPLADLRECERRLDWVWASKSEGPPLVRGRWETAEGVTQPRRPPDRVDNVIRITAPRLAALEADGEDLMALWGRLKVSAPKPTAAASAG
jgi:hypothetical protein